MQGLNGPYDGTTTTALAGSEHSSGVATCTIGSVSDSSLGPKALVTSFTGDADDLGSSDSDQVMVSAFPSRGVFVLGDATVATANPQQQPAYIATRATTPRVAHTYRTLRRCSATRRRRAYYREPAVLTVCLCVRLAAVSLRDIGASAAATPGPL
jgi:ribosomal protein S14